MRRLLIVQYGDYAEAFDRLASGGEETYLDQRRSVEFVAGLEAELAVTIVCSAAAPYRVRRAGLTISGVPEDLFYRSDAGAHIIDPVRPDIVVLRLPAPRLIEASLRAGARVLCTFADVFEPARAGAGRPRAALGILRRNRRLAASLRSGNVTAVCNHGLDAARSVQSVLGVSQRRILPWTWTQLHPAPEPRRFDREARPRFVYAGALAADKGLFDLVDAILRIPGAELDIFGAGPEEGRLRQRLAAGEAARRVRFRGRRPNHAVRAAMAESRGVVVPSRHRYPEGVPNVVFEALAARAPLVITDHPAFAGRFANGRDALITPERQPAALASCLRRLIDDPALCADLSEAGTRTLPRLYAGAEWYGIVRAFIDDPADRSGWVAPLSLAGIEPSL
jgi:glycosyltransferase involved in cell wall biosynthesis